MDEFAFPEPRYFDHQGTPVLGFYGLHHWNNQNRWWANVSFDLAGLSMFRFYLTGGRIKEISRRDFIHRFPEAASQMDNLEMTRGGGIEDLTALLNTHTNGRWPKLPADYWGAPTRLPSSASLPEYRDIPIPSDLFWKPSGTHKFANTPLTIKDQDAASRRLKGLRVGAWATSPISGLRWANWASGGVYQLSDTLTLPTELEINCHDTQP